VIEFIKNTTINDLNSINLVELSNYIPEIEFRNYFIGLAGHEHYRLLTYISTLYNSNILIDIGTFKGCSSLALSYNISNTIFSFDLNKESRNLSLYPENVTYVIDNILNGIYDEIIQSSPFILLDVNHDGYFEHEFHSHLQKINWNGILMLDDINLNNEMKSYWSWIEEEKYDISEIGHWSGTGIVKFV
jgi:predicted O-methyltransferase YrrM